MKREVIDAGDRELDTTRSATPLLSIESEVFKDVQVAIEAKLGSLTMTIQELLALRNGDVVRLATRMNEPIELRLNGVVVARGEIVAVEENFGVRILEVADLK